jgi:hypothetical protein
MNADELTKRSVAFQKQTGCTDQERRAFIDGLEEADKECQKAYKSRYNLNEKEQKALDEFIDGLPEKHKYKPIKVTFYRNSGIGIATIVKVGKKEIDITDIDAW